MRPLNVIDLVGPPQAYQTYRIKSPSDTQIKVVCEEIGCPHWKRGWISKIDERTELGAAQAYYIRHHSRRTFRETRADDGLIVFKFESGQRCFADHRTRPEIYLVREGDRRLPTGRLIRRHVNPADWVEDFGEHQLQVAEQNKKG